MKIRTAALFILALHCLYQTPHGFASGSSEEETVLKKYHNNANISHQDLTNLTESLFTLELENDATNWVSIDLQGRRKKGHDMASNHLLTIHNVTYEHEPIQLLVRLYDNYSPNVNEEEDLTAEEKQEEWDFLKAVMATPVFQKAGEFLIKNGIVEEDKLENIMHMIWFGPYCRKKKSKTCYSSSGFEHIFLGEIKKNKVGGFHNWLYFGDQESKELLDYLGYSEFKELPKGKSWIQHSFKWRNYMKPVSSMFIGTSPEFELSLYSVCWLINPNSRCKFTLNGEKFNVQTYPMPCGNNQTCVGSAYADAVVFA